MGARQFAALRPDAERDHSTARPRSSAYGSPKRVEPDFSRITLLDAKGNGVSTPSSAVDPGDAKHMTLAPGALADGVYTVSWRAISAADGHATSGSFAFAVGQVTGLAALAAPDTETIPPFSAPVRWFDLLALALAVGSVAFAVCVTCAPSHERRMRRLMGLSWVLVGLAALVLLLYQATQAANASLLDALAAAADHPARRRASASLWIAALDRLAGDGRGDSGGGATASRWRRVARCCSIHALYSHASATYDLIPAVASDWLHLTATALWVGGLAQFINLLTLLPRYPQELVPLVTRFSNYARLCVAC